MTNKNLEYAKSLSQYYIIITMHKYKIFFKARPEVSSISITTSEVVVVFQGYKYTVNSRYNEVSSYPLCVVSNRFTSGYNELRIQRSKTEVPTTSL